MSIAAPQTIFIHSLGRNFRDYLPDSFLPRTYPIRAMLDAGVRVALSSDAPVVEDDNPLVGMMAAITRRDRDGHADRAGTGDHHRGGAVRLHDGRRRRDRRRGESRQHRAGQMGRSRGAFRDPLTADAEALAGDPSR